MDVAIYLGQQFFPVNVEKLKHHNSLLGKAVKRQRHIQAPSWNHYHQSALMLNYWEIRKRLSLHILINLNTNRTVNHCFTSTSRCLSNFVQVKASSRVKLGVCLSDFFFIAEHDFDLSKQIILCLRYSMH